LDAGKGSLSMTDKARRTVYSTEPDPEPKRQEATQGGNLAAAIPTRQLNTPVRVWLDRKGRGGKTVTLIKGIMSPPAGKEALVKLLKTKLGTGGAVKEGDIEIQGDHREKIVALLNELGYKAKSAGG
jgi:translation initiation factor 1